MDQTFCGFIIAVIYLTLSLLLQQNINIFQKFFVNCDRGQTENQTVIDGATWGEQAEAAENQEAAGRYSAVIGFKFVYGTSLYSILFIFYE